MRRIIMNIVGLMRVTCAALSPMTCRLSALSAVAACTLLTGCAYTLDGKVVEGFGSVVMGRDKDPDARKGGLGGATVELIRDAGTMNRAVAARATVVRMAASFWKCPRSARVGWTNHGRSVSGVMVTRMWRAKCSCRVPLPGAWSLLECTLERVGNFASRIVRDP